MAVDDLTTAISLGAPAVLGHLDPSLVHAKGAIPAFGRVLKATALGSDLYLDLELTDQMADWISQGLYDHVSVSWYDRLDPRNPTPGKLHLRHVGWLGAQPSAMKDLALPKVADIEYSEQNGSDTPSLSVAIEFTESFTEIFTDPLEILMKTKEFAEGDAAASIEEVSTADPVQMLVNILQDGSKGYKGEISE